LNGNGLNLARLEFEKPGGKMIEVADANFSPGVAIPLSGRSS